MQRTPQPTSPVHVITVPANTTPSSLGPCTPSTYFRFDRPGRAPETAPVVASISSGPADGLPDILLAQSFAHAPVRPALLGTASGRSRFRPCGQPPVRSRSKHQPAIGPPCVLVYMQGAPYLLSTKSGNGHQRRAHDQGDGGGACVCVCARGPLLRRRGPPRARSPSSRRRRPRMMPVTGPSVRNLSEVSVRINAGRRLRAHALAPGPRRRRRAPM